MILIDLSLS